MHEVGVQRSRAERLRGLSPLAAIATLPQPLHPHRAGRAEGATLGGPSEAPLEKES